MSVTLVGLGALFTRLGRLGRLIAQVDRLEAGLPPSFESVHDQYESNDQDLVGTLLPSTDASARVPSGALGALSALAQNTLIRMVSDDESGVRTLDSALAELRRQMLASSASVKTCTVTATSAAVGTPTGTGTLVLSTKRGDGLTQENIVAEEGRLTCTSDSYTGGRTAGQELFTFTGAANAAGTNDWDWPQGSNSLIALTCVSPAQDATSTGNLLTNGDFETWSQSPEQAENWVLTTGTWATDVIKDSTALLGSFSARFAATAVTSTLRQFFASSTSTGASAGTNITPTPLTSYAVNLWLRRVSSALGAGTLRVRLVDGSNNVVNDEAGVANSFTIDLTTLTTSFVAFNGVFRLPAIMPSTLKLEIGLTVANDQPFLMDDVGLARLTASAGSSLGTGPGMAIFRGATAWKTGDARNVTTTNDRGGASYGATWQALFLRLFNRPGFLLPSAATPTIPDTLITAAVPRLAAYYPLHGQSAGLLSDYSGNARHLTPSSPDYSAGKFWAALIAGTQTYTGAVSYSSLALSLWFKFVSTSSISTGELTLATVAPATILAISANRSSTTLTITRNGSTAFSRTGLTADVWHHAVATWDGSTFSVYLDGVQVYTDVTAPTGTVATVNLTGTDKTYVCDGAVLIDGLSAADVADLYAGGALSAARPMVPYAP